MTSFLCPAVVFWAAAKTPAIAAWSVLYSGTGDGESGGGGEADGGGRARLEGTLEALGAREAGAFIGIAGGVIGVFGGLFGGEYSGGGGEVIRGYSGTGVVEGRYRDTRA